MAAAVSSSSAAGSPSELLSAAPARRLSLSELGQLPGLLTVGEAASVIGIGKSTAYDWIKSGHLPSVRLGGRRWVRTVEMADKVFGIAGDPQNSAPASHGEHPSRLS